MGHPPIILIVTYTVSSWKLEHVARHSPKFDSGLEHLQESHICLYSQASTNDPQLCPRMSQSCPNIGKTI